VNACLDAIRKLLCQSVDLQNPFLVLAPLLEDDIGDQTHDVLSHMVVDVLLYRPCAKTGEAAQWLAQPGEHIVEGYSSFELLGQFYQSMVSVSAARSMKESATPGDTLDCMDAHAYHLSAERGETCCGQKAPTPRKKKKTVEEDVPRKRKFDALECHGMPLRF
jgi:hypothetical protein